MTVELQQNNPNQESIQKLIDNFFIPSEIRVQGQCNGSCDISKQANKTICGTNCRNWKKYSEKQIKNLKLQLKFLINNYKGLSEKSLQNFLFIEKINKEIKDILNGNPTIKAKK